METIQDKVISINKIIELKRLAEKEMFETLTSLENETGLKVSGISIDIRESSLGRRYSQPIVDLKLD